MRDNIMEGHTLVTMRFGFTKWPTGLQITGAEPVLLFDSLARIEQSLALQ